MREDSLNPPEFTIGQKLRNIHWFFVFLICLIAAIGIAMLYSAANGSFQPWASRQLVRFGVGFISMIAVSLIDVRIWLRFAYVLYGLSLILLALVEFMGFVGMGAQRWLDLGYFNLQPSELMKIAMVLALARYFHSLTMEAVARPTRLVIPLMMVFAPAALVLRQPDLGTALMLIMAGGALFFVDLSIARFLRQEGVERSKREALEALLRDVAGMEDEIAKWSTEERRQNKLIAVLSAQREMKAREATRAQAAEKETREAVKVKELVIVDLSKKCNEVSNRLKEFSALYDVVKNERNKYVNLIQASSQALAEMKEKIKILLNEVEILRNESLQKDMALQKERLGHGNSFYARDQLRVEQNRNITLEKESKGKVDQLVAEIDNLNALINGVEQEMLRLKKKMNLMLF